MTLECAPRPTIGCSSSTTKRRSAAPFPRAPEAAYEVHAARSGETAFSLLTASISDILIVDLRIPDERGDVIFEFARRHTALRYARSSSRRHLRSSGEA
jgi:hypothetical protein